MIDQQTVELAMKKIVALLLFTSSTVWAQSAELQGISFFSPRSQSVDAVRNRVGWDPYIHRYDATNFYVTCKATPEFRKSYHANRIAEALFGTDKLFVSGSQLETRDPNAILADYFGLSPTFQSTVCLNPEIKNFIFTLSAYFGFDRWVPGLFLAIHAPITWTKWDFQLNETVTDNGSSTLFPALYMDENAVAAPYTSFTNAMKGNKTFGDLTQGLSFGKICGSQSKGGLSDLLLIFGYDIVSHENAYASLNLRLAAPTGNRPKSLFFFEPIIGNGKHWEFGGGFSGRVRLWEADGLQELSLFADINLTHLFKARQTRSFDFEENGFGSRFILLKQFDSSGNYTGTILPAINVTTLSCDVSVAIQFELLFMFGYTYKGFEFDIGYNGWLRSHEKISLRECIPDHTYGLKGIQDVASLIGGLNDLTQSTATLHGNPFADQGMVVDPDSPVFIRTKDLDLCSAASELLLTHKLFFYMGYGWQEEKDDWFVPFIGIGSSIEFEGINNPQARQPNRNTLNQWTFWVVGGAAFS